MNSVIVGLLLVSPSHVVRQATINVPFHILQQANPIIVVEAKVNARGPYEFLLDTGNAGHSILLTPGLAREQGLKTTSTSRTGFSLGLSQGFELTVVDTVDLGALRETDVQAAVGPAMAELAERLHTRIDGNLGYSFFKDLAITFDFKRFILTLEKGAARASGAIPIDVNPETPLIMVNVLANGKPMRFVLDTGASGCIVSEESANALGLVLGEGRSLNHTGQENGHMSILDSLSVGGHVQKKLEVAVTGFVEALAKQTRTHIDGVLGYNFWSHYRFTIDYPHGTLLLESP